MAISNMALRSIGNECAFEILNAVVCRVISSIRIKHLKKKINSDKIWQNYSMFIRHRHTNTAALEVMRSATQTASHIPPNRVHISIKNKNDRCIEPGNIMADRQLSGMGQCRYT